MASGRASQRAFLGVSALLFAASAAVTIVWCTSMSEMGGMLKFRFTSDGRELGGFDIKQEDDFSIVLFKHQSWKEPVEFMYHCSTKWAIFLMSLKSLVETGKGAPSPDVATAVSRSRSTRMGTRATSSASVEEPTPRAA